MDKLRAAPGLNLNAALVRLYLSPRHQELLRAQVDDPGEDISDDRHAGIGQGSAGAHGLAFDINECRRRGSRGIDNDLERQGLEFARPPLSFSCSLW